MSAHTKIDEIKSLRKKAELNRHCHSFLGEELSQYTRFVTTFVAIGSAFSAMTILADWSSIAGTYSWVFSGAAIFLSASVFLTTMLALHLKWNDQVQAKGKAVQIWGSFIRTAKESERRLEDEDIKGKAVHECVASINEEYREAMNITPQIPDNRFLKLKAEFKKKLWVSRELDKDTGETVAQIEERFRAQQDKNTTEPQIDETS